MGYLRLPALFDISGIYQPGFSQATNIVPTPDAGLTIRATLANPFPDGVAEPPGASLGPNTFVGRPLGRFNNDLDYGNGQSMRWSIGMQRELPGLWLVEGAYVASRSNDLTTDFNMNPVPREYLSTSNVRDQATINLLTANVANPFRPSARRAAQHVDRSASSFSGRSPVPEQHRYPPLRRIEQLRLGPVQDHEALQARDMADAAYTWSDFKEQATRLNDTDPDYEKRYHETHLTHRFVASGIWELPFGRERRF